MWNRLEGKIKSGDIILSHNGTKHTADSLDMLIKNEDNQLRQQLANQLPDALKTLTIKQRYAVLSYYCLKLRKRQIANNMGISNVMAGRHVKAGLAKLRQFYGIKK